MVSQEPPPGEVIIWVRIPCREGKERVWQAIELLRHTEQPLFIPRSRPRPVRTPPATSPVPAASKRGLKRAALYARVSTEKQEREDTVASQVDLSTRRPPPWAMTSRRRACSLMKVSVGRGSIARRSTVYGSDRRRRL